MKKILVLLVLLPAFIICYAQDSAQGKVIGDTGKPTLAQRMKVAGEAEAERSIKKYEQGRAKLEQQSIIENVKTTSQEASIVINRGYDTAGIGYNGRRFFAGVYSKISASSVQQQKTSVVNQDTRFVVQGFVGYRLNAPKWMRDNVDKVGEIIGK